MEEKKKGFKLMIVGHANHGKDTAAAIFSEKYNMVANSSSAFLCDHLVYPALKEKYNYSSAKECFDDRSNHRAEWFDLISAHNSTDLTKLTKAIFKENDIYIGIRNKREFLAAKKAGLFDYSLWVDASKRLKTKEDKTSNEISYDMTDFFLDNNATIDNLAKEIDAAMETMRLDYIEKQHQIKLTQLSIEKDMVMQQIVQLIMPKKQNKFSVTKRKKLQELFSNLMDIGINLAETSTELLTVKWPAMESKLHSLETLISYIDSKWIVSVDPEKNTKKEIVKNSEFFSIRDLLPQTETQEDESISSEARAGFESVQNEMAKTD